MKKLNAIWVKHENNSVRLERITIKDKLEELQKYVDCSTIDIITRKFALGNKSKVTIVLDDEGLLKQDKKTEISFVTLDKEGKPVEYLVGNALLVNVDEEGNLISFKDEDIVDLKKSVCLCNTMIGNYKVIVLTI